MWQEAKDAAAGQRTAPGRADDSTADDDEVDLATLPAPERKRGADPSGVRDDRGRRREAPVGGKHEPRPAPRGSTKSAVSGRTAEDKGDQSFEDLTVQELRRLAKERDVSGRSQMTKDELVHALAGTSNGQGEDEAAPRYAQRTVKELRQLAARRGIEGRSKMSKDELVRALRT